MRIALLTSKLNFPTAGGSVIDLHLKAQGLLELGHEVTVITAFSSFNNINQLLTYKVKEESISAPGLLGIQAGAYKIIKKYAKDFDVFYIDGHIFLYAGGWYRLSGGQTPIVGFFNIRLNCWADMQDNIAVTGLRKFKKWLRLLIERRLGVPIANRLDAFIFNTPQVAALYHNFGFDKKKTTVIEDFIDTKGIAVQQGITGEKIAAKQSAAGIIYIFCTGRMIKEKGFDLVVSAFAKIADKERYRVIMSGDGQDKVRLRKLVYDFGFEKYFEFPGWVAKEKLAQFFNQAHIFIFPKWWIEYGSALLTEAMAFGLPCIIPGGGALEWLTAGAAMTYIPDDIDDLAKKIEQLGGDSGLRIKLAAQVLQRAEELDYKKLSVRLAQVIGSVAG